jgi:hypothetical protein
MVSFALSALMLSGLLAPSMVHIRQGTLNYEAACALHRGGPDRDARESLPVCDESEIVLVIKKINVSYESVYPQPRVIIVNGSDLVWTEAQNTIVSSPPFEREILVSRDYMASGNFVYVAGGSGRSGFLVLSVLGTTSHSTQKSLVRNRVRPILAQ